jgi:hypothetical protein
MTFKPKQIFCVNDILCFYEDKEYEVYEVENDGVWLTTENTNQLRFFGNKELYEKFKKL